VGLKPAFCSEVSEQNWDILSNRYAEAPALGLSAQHCAREIN
jgi:hypothetical protein